MKIWMSPQIQAGRNHFLHTMGGSLGIALLGVLLAAGGSVCMIRRGMSMRTWSLLLCVAVTALLIGLAVRLGRRSARDAIVFFLDEQDHLFWADTRTLCSGRSVTGATRHAAAQEADAQRWLERIRNRQTVPPGAMEVLKVERMRENPHDYALICQVRKNGRVFRSGCTVLKGYEDEDWLIRELERRRGWENQLEQREDPSAAGMAVSGLLLLCSVAVCFFSHPAQARLPQNFYFPALALAGVGAAALLYWSVRRHRNE